MPLSCTAIGKVLLAFGPDDVVAEVLAAGLPRRTPRSIVAPGVLRRQLATIRARGVAYEHEESTVGLNCVAAPVLDAADEVVAAVSVAGPVTRFRRGVRGDRGPGCCRGRRRHLGPPSH